MKFDVFISQPALIFLQHIRYKCADPSSRVAVNQDRESQLNPVIWMDENRVVVLPNRDNNVLKVTVREHMLHPYYILNNVFFNKRFPNPLINILSILLIKSRLGETCEACKEPLGKIQYRRPRKGAERSFRAKRKCRIV